MALVKWEYGKWSNVMGYICDQCGDCVSDVYGGIDHENEIDANGGVCPVYERRQSEGESRAG